MDLNGLTFQVSTTAAAGVVNSHTRLELIQRGDRILGRYHGGSIARGYLVGNLAGRTLHFRYSQREKAGGIHGGRSRCSLDVLSDGRIRIREHFTWKTREGAGVNIFDQVVAAGQQDATLREVSLWIPWCQAGHSREDTIGFIALAEQIWAQTARHPLAILGVGHNAFLGGVAIQQSTEANRTEAVSYGVRSSSTRHEVACAALRLVSQYAFDTLGLTRLQIACHPTNAFSRRAAETVGAKFEVVARNGIVMGGAAYDAALYGLIPEDLQASDRWLEFTDE